MRRSVASVAALALASMLIAPVLSPASAATSRTCLAGHSVKVVKGKATMLLNGKRVACVVRKATPKPSASVTPSATPTSSNPPYGNNIRFAADQMNSITVRAGLTVTLRNVDAVPHTLVIASEGISVLVPANDISAFLAPSKPGTYAMTTAENAAIKGTLVVIS